MPRRTASRARSLALHWLIGTPPSSGRSHASATMAQSLFRRDGRRRARARRIAKPFRDAPRPPPASQRARQKLTPLRHTPSCRAVSPTPTPSAASTIIRARSASCCGRRMAADQAFQFAPLLRAQRDRGRTARHGVLLRVRITPSESPNARRWNPTSRNFSRGVLGGRRVVRWHEPGGCIGTGPVTL